MQTVSVYAFWVLEVGKKEESMLDVASLDLAKQMSRFE